MAKSLQACYFKISLWKKNFAEFLFVDATYKLTELCMPVYFMFTTDCNGQNDIVAVFFTATGTKVAIIKMVESFKAANTLGIKAHISDKDFLKWGVFILSFLLHLYFFAFFMYYMY